MSQVKEKQLEYIGTETQCVNLTDHIKYFSTQGDLILGLQQLRALIPTNQLFQSTVKLIDSALGKKEPGLFFNYDAGNAARLREASVLGLPQLVPYVFLPSDDDGPLKVVCYTPVEPYEKDGWKLETELCTKNDGGGRNYADPKNWMQQNGTHYWFSPKWWEGKTGTAGLDTANWFLSVKNFNGSIALDFDLDFQGNDHPVRSYSDSNSAKLTINDIAFQTMSGDSYTKDNYEGAAGLYTQDLHLRNADGAEIFPDGIRKGYHGSQRPKMPSIAENFLQANIPNFKATGIDYAKTFDAVMVKLHATDRLGLEDIVFKEM